MTYLRLVFNWLWKFIKQLLCFLDQFKTKIDFQFSSNQSNPVSLLFCTLGRLSFRRFHFLHDVESISSCAYWSRLQIYPKNMFLRFYFVLCPLVNIMHLNPQLVNILILVSRFLVSWKAFDLSSSTETNLQMWPWLRPCSAGERPFFIRVQKRLYKERWWHFQFYAKLYLLVRLLCFCQHLE